MNKSALLLFVTLSVALRASLSESATVRRHGSNVNNLDKIIQELQEKVAKSQVYIYINKVTWCEINLALYSRDSGYSYTASDFFMCTLARRDACMSAWHACTRRSFEFQVAHATIMVS